MGLSLRGTTSGAVDINAPAVAGDNTITLPGNNGAANQFYKNSGTAGIVTYSSMVEDSSGNVGIGTTSPSAELHVSGSGQQDIFIGSTNAGGVRLVLDGDSNGDGSGGDFAEIVHSTGGHLELRARNPGDSATMRFEVDTGEKMRIDSSGRVLIGKTTTSNPHTLQVQASSGAEALSVIGRSVDDQSEITFYENDNSTVLAQIQQVSGYSVFRHRTGYLRFDSGGVTERMRLDSSGNLGINNTAPDGKLAIAHTLNSAYATTSRNNVFLQVRNPSSTSGCYAGIEIAAQGAGNDSITQLTTVDTGSGNTDFVIGLRSSSTFVEKARFQNGGGISFNGDTAAANALDDFEEGTWTPQYSGRSTNGTITNNRTANAEYVKIGNQVTVMFDIDQTLTGASGDWQILGLPFTVHSGPHYRFTGTIVFANPGGLTWSGTPLLYANDGGNTIWGIQNNSGSNYSFLSVRNARTEVWGMVTYFVD